MVRHEEHIQRQHRGQTRAPQTDSDARDEFDQGRAAYEARRYADALRHFEAATQSPGLDPSRMPLLVWSMANTRAHLGDMEGAMTDAMSYGQLSASPPQSQLIDQIEAIGAQQSGGSAQAPAAMPQTDAEARAAFEQGRRDYEGGRYQEAVRHFEAATQAPGLDPSRMPQLVWNMAHTRAHLGDMEGAMTDAMSYGQLSSTPPQSELIRQIEAIGAQQSGGSAQAPAGMPQTDAEARAEFEHGLRDHAGGRYEEALRHFQSAIEAPGIDASRMSGLLWNIANIKARLGDADGAMTAAVTYRSLVSGDSAQQLMDSVASILAQRSGEQAGRAGTRGASRRRPRDHRPR